MLDFRIQTFITVCNLMNFTKAAAALHVTQPTVTQHIQYLEHLYEAKLFQYQNRKLLLTEAGRELLRASLTVSNDEHLLKERIRNLSEDRTSLSFGATLTIGEFLFPQKLNRLIETHPDWNIHMTVDNTQILLDLVDQGTLEFAAIEGFFPKTEYDYQSFSIVPFIAVCSSTLPIANKSVALEELLGERLLVREEGSGTRSILQRHLADRNLAIEDFQKRTESNNFSVLKYLAKQGKGITFLYRTAVEQELQNGILTQIPIQDFNVSHEFTFVWRKRSLYQNEYETFFHELLSYM